MNRFFLVALLLILSSVSYVQSQTNPSPLDRYLDTAKTIIVAKCLSVGPVNILLRADVEVEILLVVKGDETLRKISVHSQYGMKAGEIYLLRTEFDAVKAKAYFEVTSIDSAIPIAPYEDLAVLKTLSPRIVVLRTMNSRVESLESEIRRRSYELEALKESRREN